MTDSFYDESGFAYQLEPEMTWDDLQMAADAFVVACEALQDTVRHEGMLQPGELDPRD